MNRRRIADKAALVELAQAPDWTRVRADVVAAILDVSTPTVWRHAAAGLLPAPHKRGNVCTWELGAVKRAARGEEQ